VTIGDDVGVGNATGPLIIAVELSIGGTGDGGRYIRPGDQSRNRGERLISGSLYGAISAVSSSLICGETERGRACAITCRSERKRTAIAKRTVWGRGGFTKGPNQMRKVDGKNILKVIFVNAFYCVGRAWAFYRRTIWLSTKAALWLQRHPLHFPP
jgi:hypothetical protein